MVVLHDIESGDLHLEAGKTIQDYIAEYQLRELHKQIMILAEATGLNFSQLTHIMGRDVTEQNINEYNQFENLKLTLDGVKTRAFLEKIEGTTIPPRMVRPKADKMLRDFILDGAKREAILKAYLGVNVDVKSEAETLPEEVVTVTAGKNSEVETGFNLETVRDKIEEILTSCIPSLLPHMCPMEEIINSVFYVINTRSIDSLDGVDIFIQRAFENLYAKKPTLVDKHIAFNQLVTKFEAYLKKLYYLINGKELPARNEGDTPSWKDALYAHKCLWNLRWSTDEAKQQLYQWLLLVKGWRNEESHISPTASEQEVDTALNIILTMYFYVTGSSITALETNGHDISAADTPVETTNKIVDFTPYHMNNEVRMIAEPECIRNLPEATRIDILKRSIKQLLGYNPKKSPFTKQRHWIAVYRVAADMGLIIDGDFKYFKSIIDRMQIDTLSIPLSISYLEKTIKDTYAMNIENWTNDGLSEKKSIEYEDIKRCVDAFAKIVEMNIPRKESSK
jgi:type I restriction enzyme R subunit